MNQNFKRIRLPPALKGMAKTMKPIFEVFQKGLVIDGPVIKAKRLPDGRIQLNVRK